MREKEILRQTARSFYLTLRLLPRPVRADLTLGYLLARATDTIADSSDVTLEDKLKLLHAVRNSIGHEKIAGYTPQDSNAGRQNFAESRLLMELPALWRRMYSLDSSDRKRLEVVLNHILEGQIFDLERFVPGASPLTDDELKHYTYLVAGSVGEFWTELCAKRLHRFAKEPLETMCARARHYGQALQLVNILRDRHADARIGRIYVREENVSHQTTQARTGLEAGTAYCAALYSGRLRCATLLPILLGFRTLALMESNAPKPWKISRSEVRKWTLRSLAAWCSAEAVRRLAHKARESEVKTEQ